MHACTHAHTRASPLHCPPAGPAYHESTQRPDHRHLTIPPCSLPSPHPPPTAPPQPRTAPPPPLPGHVTRPPRPAVAGGRYMPREHCCRTPLPRRHLPRAGALGRATPSPWRGIPRILLVLPPACGLGRVSTITHTHTHTHTNTHTHTQNARTHARACACAHTHIHTHTHNTLTE